MVSVEPNCTVLVNREKVTEVLEVSAPAGIGQNCATFEGHRAAGAADRGGCRFRLLFSNVHRGIVSATATATIFATAAAAAGHKSDNKGHKNPKDQKSFQHFALLMLISVRRLRPLPPDR